jgi:nucleotide-binding universal stress UspA family protein
LDAALERLPESWRSAAVTKEATGSASGALLGAIKEQGAELAVVGFRGTTSLWEQFLLGSVSRAVVHSATVPVLVVKTPRPEATQPQTRPSGIAAQLKVLSAYDGSPASEATGPLLGKFTWPPEAEGWVMTVVRPMFPYDLPEWVKIQPRDPDVAAMAAAWEQEHQQNLKTAQEELERFRDKLPPCHRRHDVIVVEGRPAEQIVAQLRAKGIDMAVVGSRGSGRVERLLLGSTTEQVLASAPCSVLIVR